MAKEKATYQNHTITIESNGSIKVMCNDIVCKNAVGTLRNIADAVGFQYDDNWNTRQFGKKMIDFLNKNHISSTSNCRIGRTTPPPIPEHLRVKQQDATGGDVIVLNRMYCGDYLDENLGHEIINMYKSDNGKSYLYLNAHGTFDSKWANRIKTMLLVRTIEGRKMLEVIGIALGMEDVYQQGQSGKEQDQYIINNNIKYAGKYLHEIFSENQWQQDINISFVANKVLLPNKKVFLSFNPDIHDKNDQTSCVCYLEDINQAKASLKQYIEQETAPIAYNKLITFINQPRLWTTEASMVNEQAADERPTTYFDICGISHNELAFSNAIAYFFEKYPHHISGFMRTIGLSFDAFNGIKIYREKRNIDLLLTNGNKSIVIENKITSGINGIDRHDPSKSQLKKYYDILHDDDLKEKFPNPMFFVLTPNYNDIDLSQYAGGEHYTKLLYSQLFDYLKEQPEYKSDILFQNYVDAMEQHTSFYCNDQYEEMKQRFLTTINN